MLSLVWLWAGGCGIIAEESPGILFRAPLTVAGKSVGTAIVDTGGNYELLLREDFGLEVVGSAEVLALGGREQLRLARNIPYVAAGLESVADQAIIGLTVCECNGLGVEFLRKHGVVFGIDFPQKDAAFLSAAPDGGSELPFAIPPPGLDGFDTSFIEVTLAAGGNARTVVGLLDTGASNTLMRRGTVGMPFLLSPNRMRVRITHEQLGTVTVNVSLFDTDGLPKIILGTDAMRAWADRWYFAVKPEGGTVTVVVDAPPTPLDPNTTEPGTAFSKQAMKLIDCAQQR